jgi:hypothetical protein
MPKEQTSQNETFKGSGNSKERSYKALAIVILFIAVLIPVTVYGVMRVLELRTQAGPTENPKNIEVTNITDTQVTISWITSSNDTVGFIKYGKDEKVEKRAFDIRDSEEKNDSYLVHSVDVKNLEPETSYYYLIVVGGKEYDNEGQLYTFETGETLESVTTPSPVKGEVNSEDEAEVLVFLYAQKGSITSSTISTLTASKRYTLDLSNLRLADLSDYFGDLDGAKIFIQAESGTDSGSIETEILDLSNI